MNRKLFPEAISLQVLAPHWRGIAVMLGGIAIAYGGLIALEQISITYMDFWIPLRSMEEAEWYSILISTLAGALRIFLVGIAVLLALRMTSPASNQTSTARFLGFWFAVAAVLGLAVLGLDSAGYYLQFGGIAMDGAGFRTAFLLLIYAKVIAYYLFVRLLFGAGRFAGPQPNGPGAAWTTTTLRESILLFVVFLALWLSIEGIIVPLVSYTPLIAPFWFVPDESAPYRYPVSQATRIFCEAIAMVIYVLVWIRTLGGTVLRDGGAAAPE